MRWRVKCGDIMLDLKEANLFKPCMVDESWQQRSYVANSHLDLRSMPELFCGSKNIHEIEPQPGIHHDDKNDGKVMNSQRRC